MPVTLGKFLGFHEYPVKFTKFSQSKKCRKYLGLGSFTSLGPGQTFKLWTSSHVSQNVQLLQNFDINVSINETLILKYIC